MGPDEWPQCLIEFPHWPSAENVAAEYLRPALEAGEADGELIQWFFLRKHPNWRLRYRPTDNRAGRHLARVLDELAFSGLISQWTAGIYEPESAAFGGPAGMRIAHQLFHQDSRHILANLARCQTIGPNQPGGLGRRELAILLLSVAMRAAGLDLYEQGDVWAKVAALRPADDATPLPERLKGVVYRLMTVDAGPASRLVVGGPLAPLADWITAFEQAGQHIAELARRGRLERGLRAVLAHHVIFYWNRLGLPRQDQSALSTLAKEVVMGTSDSTASTHETATAKTSLGAVNTDAEQTSTLAERLRNRLADHLIEQRRISTARVEEAVRAVPRHVFVPEVSLEEAYADQAVYTKQDGEVSISAASQPTVVALMLEQLQVQPGHKVLELGAGTGYNAALLAHLTGDGGHVTTIDLDDDIVDGARSGLAAAGIGNVTVIRGDGALGHAGDAPYDRITATVGAHGVPTAWLDQLAPGGRLVVPLRLRGSVSRSIIFQHQDGAWRSIGSEMTTFMPLRGIADDARTMVALTPDGSVTLQTNREQAADPDALAGVLDQPRTKERTGVMFRGPESPEWMELWLTCTMPSGLSRMPADDAAIDSGLLDNPYPSSTAVFDKGTLTYLTRRPAAERAADGAQLYEFGVIGHGPGAEELTDQVVEAIRTWDRDYRSRDVQFAIQPLDAEPIQQHPGRFCFETPINRIIIEWH